ncbi:MAG: patatin-like phospholipase family protein [Burkholderiales bacterium]|nr:patatin-like phospholipase family protein [Burkholderiales bacterium]
MIVSIDSVRLNQLYKAVHELKEGSRRSALCLSGGGIRSGAFALGIIQALARRGDLQHFDYLSTVSGGGYVGSWLSAWVHRHPEGLVGVEAELGRRGTAPENNSNGTINPAPAPVSFLRAYSYFLNPKAGFFSVDTWTWFGIYLRNLTLNWIALIPLLLLVLALPRLYAALTRVSVYPYSWIEPSLFGVATLCAIATIVCVTVNRPSVSDRAQPSPRKDFLGFSRLRNHGLGWIPVKAGLRDRWLQRFKLQKWVLVLGVLPFLLFSVFLTLWISPARLAESAPVLLRETLHERLPLPDWALIILWGELIVIAAWLISIWLLPRRDWSERLLELLAMLLAGAIAWGLIGAFSTQLSALGDSKFKILSFWVYSVHAYAVLAVPAVIAACLLGMTLFIGLVSKSENSADEDREWWSRFGAWMLIALLAWFVSAAIVIFSPPLLFESPRLLGALGGVSGLVAVLLGKSSLTAVKSSEKGKSKPWLSALGSNTLALATLIFLTIVLALLSLLTSIWLRAGKGIPAPLGLPEALEWLYVTPLTLDKSCASSQLYPQLWTDTGILSNPQIHLEIICQTPVGQIAAAMLALALIVALAPRFINLNKFSLHSAYRNRLMRTFLGASRGKERNPNPFTGFDPLDNVQMHELQPGLLHAADILQLDLFVEQLKDALENGTLNSAAGVLVPRLLEIDRDRGQLLESRLRNHDPEKPVLKALQQDLVETLNRALASARLPLTVSDAKEEIASAYSRHGNLIFANRILLEAAFAGDIIRPYGFPPEPPHKLLHVVNLTLNLVHGRKLAWQERKAAPFIVTPLHSGCYYLGYRESRNYGGDDGISLATAATVSGAAVSPNMGYSSSGLVTLLLTLFNVRLGWWLGNPGIAGADTYGRAEPGWSLRPLVSEALGMTDDISPYVYLSDGGHFENLGLFEMVLRRCHLIVVSDAAADPHYRFNDLANAVRKIRVDLGIPIEFETLPFYRKDDAGRSESAYCAVGRIRYSCIDKDADDGILIYFKPVVRGEEPADIRNYAAENTDFPQQPTSDQFFGEAQFESYRKLGEFAVETAFGQPLTNQSGDWIKNLAEKAAVGFPRSARRPVSSGFGVSPPPSGIGVFF